jgi:hypothetical protein
LNSAPFPVAFKTTTQPDGSPIVETRGSVVLPQLEAMHCTTFRACAQPS